MLIQQYLAMPRRSIYWITQGLYQLVLIPKRSTIVRLLKVILCPYYNLLNLSKYISILTITSSNKANSRLINFDISFSNYFFVRITYVIKIELIPFKTNNRFLVIKICTSVHPGINHVIWVTYKKFTV